MKTVITPPFIAIKTETTSSLFAALLTIFVCVISASYHTSLYSAAAHGFRETLLPQFSNKRQQHILDKQLAYAAFADNTAMAQRTLERGANPNALFKDTGCCNNILARSVLSCCSSESHYKVSKKALIYPIIILSCMATIGDIIGQCETKNSEWDTFCTTTQPQNYYCDPLHKKNESWKTFCEKSYKRDWCCSTTYSDTDWIHYCAHMSPDNPSNLFCYPVLNPNKSWVALCPLFTQTGLTHRMLECKVPPIAPCEYASHLYTLTAASVPALAALTALCRLKVKTAGQRSYWWRKKINYAAHDKTPLMIVTNKNNRQHEDPAMDPSMDSLVNQHQIIQLLLQHRADTNTSNSNGDTALTFAITHNNTDIIELLCLSGANPHSIDIYGKTPLSRATPAIKILINDIEEAKNSACILQNLRRADNFLTPYIPITRIVDIVFEYSLPCIHDENGAVDKYMMRLLPVEELCKQTRNRHAHSLLDQQFTHHQQLTRETQCAHAQQHAHSQQYTYAAAAPEALVRDELTDYPLSITDYSVTDYIVLPIN